MDGEGASSGHRLGQIVGNWYEEWVAKPVLEQIAQRLSLYCDSRWQRGERVLWVDTDGNSVDYDFVFELRSDPSTTGIPVAFFETFWRRGSRHSKDKARDDSGKLVYMRDTYPTARMLAIVAAGDFTKPAQQLVRSRGIELWYTSKQNVVDSWEDLGVQIDYPDKIDEASKRRIAAAAEDRLANDAALAEKVAERLFERIGVAQLESFKDLVFARLSALPQEYTVYIQETRSLSFATLDEVSDFLASPPPSGSADDLTRSYRYETFFGDGDVFERDGLSWEEMRDLHAQQAVLIEHVERVARGQLGALHQPVASP